MMAAALKIFVDKEGKGKLPLRGTVPDMTADTDSFVALQRLYGAKAERDASAVWAHVQDISTQLDQMETLDEATVKEFCRNCDSISVLKYKSLAEELATHVLDVDLTSEGPESDFNYYILLRAADRFQSENGRFPGEGGGSEDESATIERDMVTFRSCVSVVLGEMGLGSGSVPGDRMAEMCRFGGAELHNIASLLGGIVAQEAVKLITRQFVPVYSGFVFNAITSTTTTFDV